MPKSTRTLLAGSKYVCKLATKNKMHGQAKLILEVLNAKKIFNVMPPPHNNLQRAVVVKRRGLEVNIMGSDILF